MVVLLNIHKAFYNVCIFYIYIFLQCFTIKYLKHEIITIFLLLFLHLLLWDIFVSLT